MLLGLSVDWDNHETVCGAYKSELSSHHLFASKKVVEHEASNIVRGNRISLSQFVEHHSRNDFENLEDLKSEVRAFEDNPSSLLDYVDYRQEEFEEFISGNTDSIDLLELINSDFDKPATFIQKIKSGNSFISYLNYTPTRHYSRYSSLYSRLANRVKNQDDLEVLLDSHHLTQEEDVDVAFLSFDKQDIIRNKKKIEKTLSRVSVFDPSNHI